jgi:autotransporter-associated beta strand protein
LTLSGPISDATTAAGVNFAGNFNAGTGTGVLTLSGANTYTGPTSVKNGVLEIGSIANVSQANSLGKSAASPANLTLENATLNYLGTAAATTDRGMTVSGVTAIRLGGDVTFAAAQIAGSNSQSLTLNGPGKMTLDSSNLTLTDETDKGKLWIGDGTATVLNVAGTSEVTVRSLLVGKAGGADAGKGGAVYQTGGVVNVLGDGINPYDNSFNGEIIGHSAYGYYNISGGTLNMNVYARSGYNPFILGLNAPAVFDQTGGVVNNPETSNILIGANGTAALNVTGGTFQMSLTVSHFGLLVGTISDGTLNVGGGATAATVDTASGTVILGRLESQGVVNLGVNGTLKAGGVYNAAFIPGETPGTAIFNFHGGTLAVGTTEQHASFTSFMEGLDHAYIYAEGAVIDTNGLDAAIAQNLEAPGGSGITRIDVGDGGGSGYIGAPVVSISGGSGSGATAVAVMNGDKVDHFVITNPGSGYGSSDVLTVTLSGGGFTTPATAAIGTGATYFAANVGGGLKKIGAGALSLTGVLSYPGDTIVNEGTLNVTELNTPSATVTVKDGAVLNAVSLTADTLVIGGVPEAASAAVPEPGTLSLIVTLAVSAGIGAAWRKRKASR